MNMNIDELNQEVLECCRYDEDEDLKTILKSGADVNYTDLQGNTGLHRAAANGNVNCINILLDFGAKLLPNENGNYPFHWAAQNGQVTALKTLFDRCDDIDVLKQNKFGRSTMTEAFDSKNDQVIELCLSHSSSAEERMIPEKISTDDDSMEASFESSMQDNDVSITKLDTVTESNELNDEFNTKNAVFHEFNFTSSLINTTSEHMDQPVIMNIRELPIARADNPFGNESHPEDDTTGLGWLIHDCHDLLII